MLAPQTSTFRVSVVLNVISLQSCVAEYETSHQIRGAPPMLERNAVPAAVKDVQPGACDALGHHRRDIAGDNRILIAMQDERRCANLAEPLANVMLRYCGHATGQRLLTANAKR